MHPRSLMHLPYIHYISLFTKHAAGKGDMLILAIFSASSVFNLEVTRQNVTPT